MTPRKTTRKTEAQRKAERKALLASRRATRKANALKQLETLHVGMGCSHAVGSDCYPLYITELKQHGKLIGLCTPGSHFDKDHPWEGGDMVVDKFTPAMKTSMWLKLYGSVWYIADENGKRQRGAKYRISFNGAYSYRDPSF